MKQETPEEAAERMYPMVSNEYLWHVPIETRKIFIEGAKWQQEIMYSQEDLETAYFEGKEGLYSFKEWFEQFKKK